MSDPSLPKKFAYLDDVVRKYTFPHGDVAEYEELIARLGPADLAELAAAYEGLAADPDGVLELSAWIKEIQGQKWEVWKRWVAQGKAQNAGAPLPGPLMSEPATPDPPQVFYLFFVFKLLRRRAPFKSGQVKYSPPAPKLDWTKLPEEMRWLAGPAEKYGKHQFHNDRVGFAKRITPEERNELREVVRRVWRDRATLERFQAWTQAHTAGDHPETNLIAGMWDLIVGLGEADKKPDWVQKSPGQ
jgi:hypothetical protein